LELCLADEQDRVKDKNILLKNLVLFRSNWNVGIKRLYKGLRSKAKDTRYNPCLLPYALSHVPYTSHYSMHKVKDLFSFIKL
jgi:hypothetical protein